MTNIDALIKKAEKLLAESFEASDEPKQKHKVIFYDIETRQVVYETPAAQLEPLRLSEERIVFMLPHNLRDDGVYTG